jgi:BlaI family penicillinase repressor
MTDRRPTDAELQILAVVWDRGPCTVRDVQESLNRSAGREAERGYTTVLKLMQIMLQKGLLTREKRGRAHVYDAVVSRESMRTRLIEELAQQVFGGSTLGLAMKALTSRPTTPADIEQAREMLRDMEKGDQ